MNADTVHLEALCLFVIFIKLEGFCAKCTVLAENRHASRFRREARREQQSGVSFKQPDSTLGRRPFHSERCRTGRSAASWFPVPARHGVTKILWIWAPERVRCRLRLTRDQQVACRTSLPGCYRKNSQCPSFRAAS